MRTTRPLGTRSVAIVASHLPPAIALAHELKETLDTENPVEVVIYRQSSLGSPTVQEKELLHDQELRAFDRIDWEANPSGGLRVRTAGNQRDETFFDAVVWESGQLGSEIVSPTPNNPAFIVSEETLRTSGMRGQLTAAVRASLGICPTTTLPALEVVLPNRLPGSSVPIDLNV